MEAEKEVKTFGVNLYCPDCEVPMNIVLDNKLIYQPWTYKCPNCFFIKKSNKRYPYIIHR